jgi:hypothetical protein
MTQASTEQKTNRARRNTMGLIDAAGGLINKGVEFVGDKIQEGVSALTGADSSAPKDGVDGSGGSTASTDALITRMEQLQAKQLETTLKINTQDAEYNISKGIMDKIRV